ncbi:ComF family protein [Phytoactinopolyspora limicola]|uniref:ComF family protein n=1 Tax=Phytoactinopolyspora limicola TaxID=2715536 RepID=UPI00140D2962|nr:phosphoribosyltransferase family protein [Phytoactinopolyspora limicola]
MPTGQWWNALIAAASDLAFGRTCAGCGTAPGATLCDICRADLLGPASPPREVPGTTGLRVVAAAAYAGAAGTIVVQHKERGRLGLSRPLGEALAVAVTALAAGDSCPNHKHQAVVMVPVPSRPSSTRARGHDPVLRMTRRAASVLRRSGAEATVVTGLRHVRGVADQAGLGRVRRETNLHGAMAVRGLARRLLAGHCVVLVDDVMTTGATLREAARALAVADSAPCGAAVVALAA